jgi:Arc/MetJ-type ribon-helix-helix transcriptional regulator
MDDKSNREKKYKMKEKFSVSIDENLLKWLDSQIKTKRFASRSHGIEFALTQLKEEPN